MVEKLVEIIQKEGLTIPLFFIMYFQSIKSFANITVDKEDLEWLSDNKWIKLNSDYGFEVREKFVEFLDRLDESLLGVKREVFEDLEESKKIKVENIKAGLEIKDWIDEYRGLFKGLKPGSIGDKGACLNKMVKFFENYPEFADKDIILSATRKYIQHEAISNYKYIQKAHYFIYKQVGTKDNEISNLASFCEEVGNEVETSFVKVL